MAVAQKTLNVSRLHVSRLSESDVTALRDSTVLLTRFFFDAVNELHNGVPVEDTWLAEYLPMRYRAHYDEEFGRRFLTCLLSVSARVWNADVHAPTCIAEQLAFRALLDFAQATLEERGIDPGFGPAWEQAIDDLDVKTLFDENHVVEPRLEFSEWFHPLDEAAQIHPSIRFEDRVVTRIS